MKLVIFRKVMDTKNIKHPLEASSHREKRLKHRRMGEKLAFLSIAFLVVLEIWGYFVVKTIKPDLLAYQYFRFLLEIPMTFFFFNGHQWALWIFRAGFAFSAPAAIYLCVLLIHRDVYLFLLPTAFIPVILSIIGTSILFVSEDFMLHFKHKRHERSIYD